MKANSAWRLTLQSLLHLIASAVLALVSTAMLATTADALTRTYRMRELRSVLSDLESMLGMPFLMGAAITILFLLYFILFQLISYRYFDRVNKTMQQMADGELPFDYEIEVRRGNPFRHTAIHMNRISSRLHLALEEERRAERTKNELITNVSHDLRTPLTSILGYLGLIEQDKYRDEVELRHYVQIAYDKSQRLNVLIQDLFDFTRMRNDSISLNKISLNATELLGELLMHYEVQLREAGMKGSLHASETKIMIKADPDKLVRVFDNLIMNAISYGQEGKRLDIELKRTSTEAVIAVINYGEPISAHDLPYLFDRFYRADKSRTEWAGGSGLGLAIAKSIAELHGGSIVVSSDSHCTVFRVSLPLE